MNPEVIEIISLIREETFLKYRL